MSRDQSTSEVERRVVPFRPRTKVQRDADHDRPGAPVNDLSRYERADEHDDYGDRMRANLVAFAFIALLIFGGIWIVDTLVEMRKKEDCVLSGRRTCEPIAFPSADSRAAR